MATSRTRTVKKTAKKTQVEINRIKPVGVLSLETMQAKSAQIATINVQLPDGEIYEFYHLPVTVERSRSFLASRDGGEESRLDAMIELLTEILVTVDGKPFADMESFDKVDNRIIAALANAILASSRDEGGED